MRLTQTLLVICLTGTVFTKNVHNSQPPTLVDVLRQRYFNIEDALWHVINSGMEQSYVLQQIHSGHRTFLRDDFAEKKCYFSTFDPDQQVLSDAIKEINLSVTTTVENYLHSSRRLFRESDSLAISARNLNLTDKLDKLFEITGTSDFYMTIRNVSIMSGFIILANLFCLVFTQSHVAHKISFIITSTFDMYQTETFITISDVLISSHKNNSKTEEKTIYSELYMINVNELK